MMQYNISEVAFVPVKTEMTQERKGCNSLERYLRLLHSPRLYS